MQPLWAGKAASITAGSGVGRTPAEAESRAAEIDEHAGDDAPTVRERLAASGAEALGMLQDMDDAGLAAGDASGEFTARAVLERYIIAHMDEHRAEIRRVREVLGH